MLGSEKEAMMLEALKYRIFSNPTGALDYLVGNARCAYAT
jgi:hypothetical protein